MRLTYNDIAAHLGLSALESDLALTVAVTDSREAAPGALFVCIPGSRVDGHDFVPAAVSLGASAVLASKPLPDAGVPVLLVEDTVKALGSIAALWRDKTRAKVVGVTGTAGKTTLKEVLAQVLAVRGKTARNALNNNNQIGMPRAMLTTDGDEDFWVMEAGISHEGDMEELSAVLRPDIGVILNVGAGHTEGLGKKGVAWHKSRLLTNLAPGGIGLVCADYPDLVRDARATGAELHFFSATGRAVEYRASYAGPAPAAADSAAPVAPDAPDDRRGLYHLWLDGTRCVVTAPFRGEYGAENVIAVAAVAHQLGLSNAEIAQGLTQSSLPVQRFNQTRVGQWLLIDDTYNANPLSMRRMLDAAAERAAGRLFVPVLGEMLELGSQAAEEHEALGRHVADLKPAAIFWKGGHGEDIRAGLTRGGYTGPWFEVYDAAAFASEWAQLSKGVFAAHKTGGVALFKGSRGNRLESLLQTLTGPEAVRG
ncbi:MAG: UDP-N-acetylmuramoylalanyl-D-glutamyl-2, 6-diaminopimelate--D-alanyl-D-alanine ligase [Desulfovibrio sp.]|uniref:UDP-N-acetylmuramoyl-tripeptide--D-alanyl-D- alanine ligase n=1 Tax=Desulfovibrio sp. TaxID=885 RepID=UPI00135E0124|nr:Mur ligase family protein [Desulfovibrio sp.]MTJ92476.1 UDP-N-acetylmuramoylalanyl-D-glutamyl-2, 6-diaminopimelate--D-alanyl-D-alanine ligase [Desulfovibrio sp.]